MATARASDLPVLIVSGADSPRSRIGRGLESIGGMTAETLQRISTAVGGVVKSPGVLMAKVGGLASPRATTPTAPLGSSLEERVYHLEIQMMSLEEKISSMTVVTELDLSTRSHKEKPRIAKPLLQEMETDKMLEKRVQMLEDRANERMERFEKALLSIQSRLDHVEFSKRESVAGFKRQESLSGEPQYYDAEQQSDNFEALEAIEQNIFGGHDVPSEAIGGSPTFEKSHVKETSFGAPTTIKQVEPLQEIPTRKNDDFLEPQVVSNPVYSKEAFLTQPMKSGAPNSEPAESVHRDDASNLFASSDRQLASTLEELHGSFVTESSAAAASAKFLEIARAVTAEKSTLAHASLEPQSRSVLEEPQEAFPEEPSAVVPIAKFEEHAQEDVADKNGTTIAAAELPLPPTFEATQKDFMKEPLVAAPNAKLTQELATSRGVVIALASSKPLVTSKSVEEPSMAVPSDNSEEPAQEDTSDKSVTMTADEESPKAFAFQDPQEDFVKESLASAPRTGPTHEPLLQEDSRTTSNMALVSSESPVASKSMEEPSTATPGVNFEEPTQEDADGKSGSTIAIVELPLALSLEEPQKESVKEFMVAAPSDESAQVLATQEDNDIQVSALESQMASQFVEEPLAVAPSADSEEPTQEDVADKIGTTMVATESSLASSLEEPKEGFEEESTAFAPSGKPAQEHSDMVVASSETEGASKFVEEASTAIPSANFGEREHTSDADKSGTIIAGVESPLASSFDNPQKDFEKESSATSSSVELVQELATQEDSSMALALLETTMKSKFAKDPSTVLASAYFEEPVRKDANKGVTMTTIAESPLPTSHQGPREDFEKSSLAGAPSARPIHEPSSQEDSGATSDKTLASSKPQVASKFVEEPSSSIPSTNFEELARKDEVDKSVTMNAAADSPLSTSHEGPWEDFEKESLASAPSARSIHEPSSQEDSGATNDKALASFEPQVASKFVEEPLSSIPSANFEKPTRKDEGPWEDFEESLATAPSARPIHEPSSQEDSGVFSDVKLASSDPPRRSKSVEEPSSDMPSAYFEKRVQEDGAVKSDPVIVDVKSPLASSFEEPQEEKESMATVLGIEPIQELEMHEESDMASASSKPQVASKVVEEPSIAVPSASFEELAHEDAANKSVTMTVVREDPQEDFVKESLVAPLNAEPAHELLSQEDLDATSNMAFASSVPHLASKFVEKPSPAIPSANFEEPTQDKDVVKSDTMSASLNSPLASSFEEVHEDFEKESVAATSNREPIQGLATEEDSHMAPTSSESQEASKSMEEPSTTVPSADFEEPIHEDTVDKSVAMTTAGVSPFASSFEGPQDDSEKESIATTLSIGPAQELAIQEDSDMAPSEPQVASKFVEEPLTIDVPSAKFEEPAHEDTVNKSGSVIVVEESPSVSSLEAHSENYMKESLAVGASAKVFEPIGEDESGKNPIAFAPLEAPSASFFGIPQEASSKEPSGTSVQPEELAQEKSKIVLPSEDSTLTSTVEEGNYTAKEAEYKLAEDFKVHHGRIKSIEKEFPRSQSNLAQVDSDESLAVEDSDGRLESDQSGEEFFDVEHDSGNLESWESNEPKSFEEFGAGPDELGEATGINAVVEKETLVPALSVEPTQEPEQQFEQPAQEPEQEDLTRNSAMALPLSEPQVTSKSRESQELLIEEPLAAVPSTKFEEPPQVHAADKSGTRDLPLTSTSKEPQIDTIVSPDKSLSSASFHQSGNPELLENLKQKSLDTLGTISIPQDELEREPLTTTPTIEIAQGHEESSLTSIAEEPQSGSRSFVVEGKHVKIIAKPIEEAIPRTQSDSTHVQLNPEAAELDTTKLQSQGSFLAFGDTSVDSKEALAKEPLPSAKLLELFEEEKNSGKRGSMLADSPMTSTMEEPQKPLVEEPLANAKSIPKGHAKRRGFTRSSSEPQFAYKLEEHPKLLAKESSVTAVPRASKLGEEHDQEDFGDTQCLPFRILGEGKHPRKESEFKMVEDVKSLATKSETNPKSSLQSQASNPYVLEPKPSKIKEKKKKEKKERKLDATVEEKERRLSLGSGEMERKSSLRAEEKDNKYSPRAEEKHKQPFRHLRERLRHAFSVNKEL